MEERHSTLHTCALTSGLRQIFGPTREGLVGLGCSAFALGLSIHKNGAAIMNPERREFLINEYSNLNQLVVVTWTVAYSILSGGIVLFGFLVTQVRNRDDSYAFMLTLAPTVLSLVLGQLTYAGYFCYFRMLEIAKEFEVRDLWHRWDDILRKANKKRCGLFGTSYAGSFPMMVVLYIGILLTPCYVFTQLYCGVPFYFSVVMSVFNLWLTHHRLDPSSFYDRLKNDLDK